VGELRREEVEVKPLYFRHLCDNFSTVRKRRWKFLDDFVLNSGAMLEYSSTGTLRLGLSGIGAGRPACRNIKAYRPPSTTMKFGNTRYYFSGQIWR
jgi:hypothetical protein